MAAEPTIAGRVLENRLVWLDVSYGPNTRRKSLGGSVGRVKLELTDQALIPLLILGQYIRTGETTNFGFGAYRIQESGPDPFECSRGHGLLELAFGDPLCWQRAGRQSGPPQLDTFQQACQTILSNRFEPDPHSRIPIPRAAGGWRELSVPSPRDRGIQRRLLEVIGPGLEAFFESSSYAYRRGLGRWKAATALRDAFRRGFRFAWRADFRRYFDSIDHVELQARLDAYLNDDAAVAFIMQLVRAGTPFPGRGIPTGAPLSPLLASLFLDEFDQRIAAEGGRLVRYADDFMILFRDQSSAETLRKAANDAAADLLLSLNAEKTQAIDLREPFDFLGYRFHKGHRWQTDGHANVIRAEDLGWYDAAPTQYRRDTRLPGEQVAADETAGSLVIFGPAPCVLRFERGFLVGDYRDGQPPTRIALEHVREVLLLGAVSLTHRATRACADHGANILLADALGNVFANITDADGLEEPEVLAAQMAAAQNPALRIEIARRLLAAKVENFAALARAIPTGPDDNTPTVLQELVERMRHAQALNELIGFEGAAAACWYRTLPQRLPDRFSFARRVAPSANDPINVLLNIAHTALYRQAALAARLGGFSPAIGILHETRRGHLSLASDLMEPFRHLMERVVLEAAAQLKPGQFRPQNDGPYALRSAPDAARRFNAEIYQAFEQPVIARGQMAARSYRLQLVAQVRSLRRSLLDPDQEFLAFRHYPAGPPETATS